MSHADSLLSPHIPALSRPCGSFSHLAMEYGYTPGGGGVSREVTFPRDGYPKGFCSGIPTHAELFLLVRNSCKIKGNDQDPLAPPE